MSKYILPTYTGKLFDLENPTPEMICIEDIAHHLSLENRYNGGTKFPYSVAQHSLLVSQFVPKQFRLEALLHDAEEAYYKDLPSPWKKLIKLNLKSNLFDTTIGNFGMHLNKLFKLDYTIEADEAIKIADLRMATTEILDLFDDYPPKYWQHEMNLYPRYAIYLYEQCPRTVEQMFKDEFHKLKRD